mmetsp:Transcript_17310/g.36696  ORF Transcript_17310/g.36696 Transcript_17310/m.36696 type:complete len:86 (+) Transcript_17310:585-842(+)
MWQATRTQSRIDRTFMLNSTKKMTSTPWHLHRSSRGHLQARSGKPASMLGCMKESSGVNELGPAGSSAVSSAISPSGGRCGAAGA